jgi:hypothetical protein
MADLFSVSVSVPPEMQLSVGRKKLGQVLRAAGAEVAARARALIRARRIGGKKKHVSTPGMPPVSRTGVLASSIKVRLARNSRTVSIIDAAAAKNAGFYALFLEKGARGGGGNVKGNTHVTKSGTRRMNKSAVNKTRVLLPHPFLSRALEEVSAAGLNQRIGAALIADIKFSRAARGALPK